MECFVKKIFQSKIDGEIHKYFVRFGKGVYEGRAVLSLQKTNKIKLRGSFEYANDFVLLVSELADVKFSGIILSKETLGLENEKKKSGLYFYDVKDLNNNKIKEIFEKVYCFLLDAEGEGINLKIKKKLPKSGKAKIDDKFCKLEADLKFYPEIKQAFFWDVPDCRKVKAEHVYEISELIMPEGEKDFEIVRKEAKRKGKITRKLEVDGKQQVREKDFVV